MVPVRKTNQKTPERVIQNTREESVKNVSGENLSYNDILYNLIKQFEFCFKRCSRFSSVCKRIIIFEKM